MKKGDVFHHSFTVSEGIYRGFLELFRDQNPLHCDSDYAVQKGFTDFVMHGNILNGFLSYFVGECLPIKNVMLHSQTIQYLKPVYLKDRLGFYAELTHVSEAVHVFEFDFYFEKEGQGKVAKGKFQIGELK